MIIYITGPSGSGKTTLAKKLYTVIKNSNKPVIHLDGDSLRFINNDDLGHSELDRFTNAQRMQKLCQFLDNQGIDVIVSMMLIYDQICDENYELFKEFFHFNLIGDINLLQQRDNKNIYTNLNNELIQKSFLLNDKKKHTLNSNNDVIDNLYFILDILKIDLNYYYALPPKNESEWWHKYNDYEYLGTRFLDSYLIDRKKFQNILSNNSFSARIFIHNYLFQQFNDESEFSLNKHLYLLNEECRNGNYEIETLKIFIKKFEVSKKLYKLYDSNLNKINSDLCSPLNYVILSSIICCFLESSSLQRVDKIILINSLIKIHDLVIGKFSNLLIDDWKYIFGQSINIELNTIKDLV